MNRALEVAEGVRALSKDDVEELKRLRAEVAELRMERDVPNLSSMGSQVMLTCFAGSGEGRPRCLATGWPV